MAARLRQLFGFSRSGTGSFSLSLTLIFSICGSSWRGSYVRRVIANLARDIGDAVLFAYLSA